MKLKEGFVIKNIGLDTVAIYAGGDTVDLGSTVVLNPSAEFFFSALVCDHTEDSLTELLASHYDISEEKAKEDVRVFLAELKDKGFLSDD